MHTDIHCAHIHAYCNTYTYACTKNLHAYIHACMMYIHAGLSILKCSHSYASFLTCFKNIVLKHSREVAFVMSSGMLSHTFAPLYQACAQMHLHLQVQMQMRHLHLHLQLIALRRMHLRNKCESNANQMRNKCESNETVLLLHNVYFLSWFRLE